MRAADPRTPCIIGVAARTWHPDEVGEEGAPAPLRKWVAVAGAAAAGAGPPAAPARRASLRIVYCQTWQYDDAAGRLASLIGASPRQGIYSGIGGTTPQVLLDDAVAAIRAGDLDLALVTGAEALATSRAFYLRGEPPRYRFRPSEEREFPWEAPFHPAEIAHDVWQAWLTFALFESARRAHLGRGLDEHRDAIGRMLAPMTQVAAANPHAWFRLARSADEIVTPSAVNRMVAYPYTKYTIAAMDVDMAAAVIVASEETADALAVPFEKRVYPRGSCHARGPTYVAEHRAMWRSPAMAAAADEALRVTGIGIDDVAHLDLYSCFASSVGFALDALGITADDPRPLTVTGGLPYHGGPASNYLTHSVAAMVETLRADPGAVGLVSGVGMHMTKHAFATYSTVPGRIVPPDTDALQAQLDSEDRVVIFESYPGPATVAAYSVVHGRDGVPEWGLCVCDLPGGGRCYAKIVDPSVLADAERRELVGAEVELVPMSVVTPHGEGTMHIASLD